MYYKYVYIAMTVIHCSEAHCILLCIKAMMLLCCLYDLGCPADILQCL